MSWNWARCMYKPVILGIRSPSKPPGERPPIFGACFLHVRSLLFLPQASGSKIRARHLNYDGESGPSLGNLDHLCSRASTSASREPTTRPVQKPYLATRCLPQSSISLHIPQLALDGLEPLLKLPSKSLAKRVHVIVWYTPGP